MSQDLRDYDLIRVDKNDSEAYKMSVTATVGPKAGELDETRGVQITFDTPNGHSYARVSEPQIRDLIGVLEKRIDPDGDSEATGWEASRPTVFHDGTTSTDM